MAYSFVMEYVLIIVPVKCWFALQDMRMHQLLKQTVHQYGQRGEGDIIQRQIYAVIKSL